MLCKMLCLSWQVVMGWLSLKVREQTLRLLVQSPLPWLWQHPSVRARRRSTPRRSWPGPTCRSSPCQGCQRCAFPPGVDTSAWTSLSACGCHRGCLLMRWAPGRRQVLVRTCLILTPASARWLRCTKSPKCAFEGTRWFRSSEQWATCWWRYCVAAVPCGHMTWSLVSSTPTS